MWSHKNLNSTDNSSDIDTTHCFSLAFYALHSNNLPLISKLQGAPQMGLYLTFHNSCV